MFYGIRHYGSTSKVHSLNLPSNHSKSLSNCEIPHVQLLQIHFPSILIKFRAVYINQHSILRKEQKKHKQQKIQSRNPYERTDRRGRGAFGIKINSRTRAKSALGWRTSIGSFACPVVSRESTWKIIYKTFIFTSRRNGARGFYAQAGWVNS